MPTGKRKRPNRVELYLTDDELTHLSSRMAEAGLINRQEFLRVMALDGYIARFDLSELKEIRRLIANACGNINQIAKRANETRSIYGSDLISLKQSFSEVQKSVVDALTLASKMQARSRAAQQMLDRKHDPKLIDKLAAILVNNRD